MHAAVACLLGIVLFVGAIVEPALAAHKRTKGGKKRLAARLHRAQEGKRMAIELLQTAASPQLQSLAGLNDAADAQQSQHAYVLDGDNAEEVAREDDITVDIATIRALWMAYVDGGDVPTGISPSKVMDFIMAWLGRPYRFGGTTEHGIDCSAFMQALFRTCAGALLPRTAQEQFAWGQPVDDPSQLQFGDLVFFHTRSHAYVSHVGIYLGDNLFAHASSRYGVTISSLESTYYRTRYIGARRLTPQDLAQLALQSELR